MQNFILSQRQHLLFFSLFLIFFSGCVGVASLGQRQGKLMKNCQKMMGKSKEEVLTLMNSEGLMEVVHAEVLANGEEVLILEKKLVKNHPDRYIDRVMLVFRDGKLAEYEIKVKD